MPGDDRDSEYEQKIRERAYELWEKAGRPTDRTDEFWHQAREQIPYPPEPPNNDSADSFPASDPPSNSGIIGVKAKSAKAGEG